MNRTIAALNIENISEGDIFSFKEELPEQLIHDFASLSGDYNPLHTEEHFAQSRGFKTNVVHGAILISLFSRLVGMYIPGKNAILQSLNIHFLAPAYAKDTVLIKGIVDQVSHATQTIVLKVSAERLLSKEILTKGKIQIGFTKNL